MSRILRVSTQGWEYEGDPRDTPNSVEEFFLSGGPSSSAEVRGLVDLDIKEVEGVRQQEEQEDERDEETGDEVNGEVEEVTQGSTMYDDSCIGINYAHAHMFPKCFKSLHTSSGFALCFVSSILIFVAVTIYSILTCTRIPCRVHTANTGPSRCCL